ncbi:MAG TPA: ATP-dependent Clp protease ATP-binding subunit [Ktedonobacterales bacterium]|nr:ATP-dependent Clp protease ATP-binding subunit [Ktedonobacterales bacterium]
MGDGAIIEDLITGVEEDYGPEALHLRTRGERDERGEPPNEHAPGDDDRQRPGIHGRFGELGDAGQRKSGTPTLDSLGRDLTALAHAVRLREVIGRKQELVEIGQALVRQERNAPVLVGEAGVGKTAIAEGFAYRLAQEAERPVAPALRGKRIVEIRVADLVAGADMAYRGAFETRIQQLLRECAAHPEIILFIDEIHTLVGAGHSSRTHDAAQLIKPALASGELRLIGATTPDEYLNVIASDAALERRMQPIRVEELSPDDTEQVLRSLLPRFTAQNHATVTPEALHAAIDLSLRYLPDRRLPDKAIDLLDAACAQAVVGDRLSFFGDPDAPAHGGVVTPEVIAEVVARRVGVPVGVLSMNEQDRFLTLEQTLRKRVIAQDEALITVAQALKVSSVSYLRDPLRPKGVLLIAGPTGVGKTETARAIADALFGDARRTAGAAENTAASPSLLQIDMVEFGQEHMVAQIIGSPPGYIGSDREGRLTGWLRRHPYSVVLLDEVEKAHPSTLKLMLNLFEEGRLTDAQGRTVNGREAIYIMTSNAVTSLDDPAATEEGIRGLHPPEEDSSQQESILRRRFAALTSPELVNRIDALVLFRRLDAVALTAIAQQRIDLIADRMQSRGITLATHKDVKAWLVAHGTDPHSGARSLARLIQQTLMEQIADLDLRGLLTPGAVVRVTVEGDRLVVSPNASG